MTFQWKNIESAPKDGTRILGKTDDGVCVFSWEDTSYEEEVTLWQRGNKKTVQTVTVSDGYWSPEGDYYNPTSWMNIPV